MYTLLNSENKIQKIEGTKSLEIERIVILGFNCWRS